MRFSYQRQKIREIVHNTNSHPTADWVYLEVKKSIKIAKKLIKGQGRILVRSSGTESKIRVMGEGGNKKLLNKCINIISKKIK